MSIDQSRLSSSLLPNLQLEEAWSEVAQAVRHVKETMMPVWPLQDYVAVNPFLGLIGKRFLTARAYLKVFSDCEMLMPLCYFASQYTTGNITARDIEAAIVEVETSELGWCHYTVAEIVKILQTTVASEDLGSIQSRNYSRQIRTYAEHADAGASMSWSETIRDEISKFCSTYFDQGQASWENPRNQWELYHAWRSDAQIDRNLEILGLNGVRALVAQLPHSPETAIAWILDKMQVPPVLWSTVLLCQAYSVSGWMALAKFHDENSGVGAKNLVGLLAARLAYDFAISEAFDLRVDWKSFVDGEVATFRNATEEVTRDAWLRFILLKASEINYRQKLLNKLTPKKCTAEKPPTFQMVFCIDVRSERMRRHLESVSSEIQTLGFAGFFGIAMEYKAIGRPTAIPQLPVLLKPKYSVEELADTFDQHQSFVKKQLAQRNWRHLWSGFQSATVSCFGFVETTGMFSIASLIKRTLGGTVTRYLPKALKNETTSHEQFYRACRPRFEKACHEKIEIAIKILQQMGLVDNFAKLVVLCGHKCQTSNNPLSAGLDCGACGGHSGEPNARVAASLLNELSIRKGLQQRGIEIPSDTLFVAAVHNTTTDQIEFIADGTLTHEQLVELRKLDQICTQAQIFVYSERMATLGSSLPKECQSKADDWSELRPEWGLAGNAAFIIGPRELTRGVNLDGTAFLHSYNAAQDKDGVVLEAIMTAPMIVANWINMQYYASAVNNDRFGSGSKTIHNVVGEFGILSGNAGDLQTGLPWQSIHDGKNFRHLPLRLLVVIAAPIETIGRIIDSHELLTNLVTNGWINVVALDKNTSYRYTNDGWRETDETLADCDIHQ